MKKKILPVVMLMCVLATFLTGCLRPRRTYRYAPGKYAFDMTSLKTWGEFEIYDRFKGDLGLIEHSMVVEYLELGGAYLPKEDIEHITYTNCWIKFLIVLNGKEYYQTISLDGSGNGRLWWSASIDPTYTTNLSCKIVDAGGAVVVPMYDGAFVKSDKFFYEINLDVHSGNYEASLTWKKSASESSTTSNIIYKSSRDQNGKIVNFKKMTKRNRSNAVLKNTLYFEKYINVDGTRVIFNPQSICNLARFGSSWSNSLNSVKTLIFDGDFDLEDFFWRWIGTISNGYYEHSPLHLKDNFPNLERIVIKNVTQLDVSIILEHTFILPESGVDFYINDSTVAQQFTKVLRTTNFVKNIYPFDDFDISKYRK